MIPSSGQWSSVSSTNIFVYPTSAYAITPTDGGTPHGQPRRGPNAKRASTTGRRPRADASRRRRGGGGGGTATAHHGRRPSAAEDDGPRTVVRGRRERARRVDDGDAAGDRKSTDGTRFSANVVLLAHSNRSLHVLAVQRCQSYVAGTRKTGRGFSSSSSSSSSTAVIRYKLPGGQMVLTDDENDNYKLEDKNTCTCPDDQRWYTAALEHFIIQQSLTDVLASVSSSKLKTVAEDSPSNFDDHLLQYVLLGKWYRTQNKNARELLTNKNHSNSDKNTKHSQCSYYPYKSAHIDRQTVKYKRVYVIPDAVRLFQGGQIPFRLRVPRAKTKTVVCQDGTISATETTTYKYKFIPLARLHENNRVFGPILSSLPVVLSSLNLIYLP